MSEQEEFETWLKDNNIFQYEEGEYHDPVDVEVLEFSGMVWQACADRKDKIIEQQAAEIQVLREGLIALLNVAERCDSWESFPSNALAAAYKVLEGSK